MVIIALQKHDRDLNSFLSNFRISFTMNDSDYCYRGFKLINEKVYIVGKSLGCAIRTFL